MTEVTVWQRGRRAGERGTARSVPIEICMLGREHMSEWLEGYDSIYGIAPRQTPAVSAPAQAVGGLNDYWTTRVEHPQRQGQAPYTAECEDLIQSLGLTFDEGCAFKALWRIAQTRKGIGKPGGSILYDAEKTEHYGKRIADLARRGVDKRERTA